MSTVEEPPLEQPQHSVLAGSELLEIELSRLLNSVRHLEHSNVELRAALEASRRPPSLGDSSESNGGVSERLVYQDALSENILAIAKQRARIAALEEQLAQASAVAGGGSSGVGGSDAASAVVSEGRAGFHVERMATPMDVEVVVGLGCATPPVQGCAQGCGARAPGPLAPPAQAHARGNPADTVGREHGLWM
jgi:hypothetical protein